MDWVWSVFTDLSIFLDMPFTIEPIFPEQTFIWVCLVISVTIRPLERMWVQNICFYLETRRVGLLIHLATPPKLMMVFRLVRAIALDVLGALNTAWHGSMSPSPTILVLRDIWVHIGSLNSSNKSSYIKAPINKTFSLTTTLNVPDINPNNYYIRLRRNFDNLWF